MKVNNEFIQIGMSSSTLNQAQLKILGQSYPPSEDWELSVLDRELSTKETNLFLLLRGKLSLKAQEQIIKNYQLLADFHKPKKEEVKKEEIKKVEVKKEKKNLSSEMVEIYCDGACKGNPGKAGSGLAIYSDNEKPILLYGEYEAKGTNNTAELNALYKALLIASKASQSTIYSDSKYSIDCISTWAYSWKRNGWKKRGGEIKNLEIIKTSHELYERIKNKVVIKHVKGHAGVEGNELADRMAVWAIVSKSDEYQTYEYGNIDDVLRMSED